MYGASQVVFLKVRREIKLEQKRGEGATKSTEKDCMDFYNPNEANGEHQKREGTFYEEIMMFVYYLF